ncbi:MAG: hypothetical protein IPO08_21690 [Xanthomonadales bacterium]|nr:hypothetical protein [Xanthomonadales bacterium]
MTAVSQEIARRDGAKARVLEALQRAGLNGCTNVDLCRPEVGGMRAVGRVHELRHEGHTITKQHEGGGIYRYWLRPASSCITYVTTAAAVAQRPLPPLPDAAIRFTPPPTMPVYTTAPTRTAARPTRTTSTVQGELF